MNLHSKRLKEKKVVNAMIDIYVKKHPSKQGTMEELRIYVNKRIDLCPVMETKTFCSKCKIHCYEKNMKNEIKEVMAFSGKRIMFYHPIIAIKHMIGGWQ